jgi:hypothetical protein
MPAGSSTGFHLRADCLPHWAAETGGQMSKTGRKRRSRKKKSANHGKRPNA